MEISDNFFFFSLICLQNNGLGPEGMSQEELSRLFSAMVALLFPSAFSSFRSHLSQAPRGRGPSVAGVWLASQDLSQSGNSKCWHTWISALSGLVCVSRDYEWLTVGISRLVLLSKLTFKSFSLGRKEIRTRSRDPVSLNCWGSRNYFFVGDSGRTVVSAKRRLEPFTSFSLDLLGAVSAVPVPVSRSFSWLGGSHCPERDYLLLLSDELYSPVRLDRSCVFWL